MTFLRDEQIANSIKEMFGYSNGKQLFETCSVTVNKNTGAIGLLAPQQATQYYLRRHNLVVVDIPPLNENKEVAVAQLALAVGRRLERFERGKKANATRTPNSRQKIAQNAVQSRWSAK